MLPGGSYAELYFCGRKHWSPEARRGVSGETCKSTTRIRLPQFALRPDAAKVIRKRG